MTKIKFFKKNSIFVGFECSGHTGYDDYGKDILCASISALTQGCALGVTKTLGIDAGIVRRDGDGYIKMELPADLSEEKLQNASMLMAVLYDAMSDLKGGYPKYIKMEVIENVY